MAHSESIHGIAIPIRKGLQERKLGKNQTGRVFVATVLELCLGRHSNVSMPLAVASAILSHPGPQSFLTTGPCTDNRLQEPGAVPSLSLPKRQPVTNIFGIMEAHTGATFHVMSAASSCT